MVLASFFVHHGEDLSFNSFQLRLFSLIPLQQRFKTEIDGQNFKTGSRHANDD